jgi:hypothetical protein
VATVPSAAADDRATARTSAWPAQMVRKVAATATGAHGHDSVSTMRSSGAAVAAAGRVAVQEMEQVLL